MIHVTAERCQKREKKQENQAQIERAVLLYANHNIFQKCSCNKSTFGTLCVAGLLKWKKCNSHQFINYVEERETLTFVELPSWLLWMLIEAESWCIEHEYVVELKDCFLMIFKLFFWHHTSMSRIRTSDEQTCWCVNEWILSRSITFFLISCAPSSTWHGIVSAVSSEKRKEKIYPSFSLHNTPPENPINMSIF